MSKNKKELYIGIDPGLKGAIAFFQKEVPLSVIRLPREMKPGRKGGYQTSASRLLKQLDGLPIKKAYIELVHSRPGNSGKSSFSFGCNYCALFGVFAALDIPMEFITPKVWKTTFDLINKEKDESRKKALQLFPHLHLSLFRVVDCDKADAIFIGLAGKKRGKK